MAHITWDDVADALRCTPPFVSLVLIGMGIVRYLRDKVSDQSRRWVRWSLAAYAIHLVITLLPPLTRWMSGSALADISVLASLFLRLPILLTSIYFGFKSRAASGRRVAFASIAAIFVPSTWIYTFRVTA
jgi:hypothetical protein